jgi:hypothetical protein
MRSWGEGGREGGQGRKEWSGTDTDGALGNIDRVDVERGMQLDQRGRSG